jgi:hypothetical protein
MGDPSDLIYIPASSAAVPIDWTHVPDVEDSENRCERLAVGNMFGVAVPGFSISTLHVSTDSSRV